MLLLKLATTERRTLSDERKAFTLMWPRRLHGFLPIILASYEYHFTVARSASFAATLRLWHWSDYYTMESPETAGEQTEPPVSMEPPTTLRMHNV